MVYTFDMLLNDVFKPAKGILAIDESEHTSQMRFEAQGLTSTPEARRRWRSAIITTPNLGDYLSGIILVEETLLQTTDDGRLFAHILHDQNIGIFIKTDQGLTDDGISQPMTLGRVDLEITLKHLLLTAPAALVGTKGRSVFYQARETTQTLSPAAISSLEQLAQYASIVQNVGLVPIVEPEIIISSTDTLDKITTVTNQIMNVLAHQLTAYKVDPAQVILKISFVYSTEQTSDFVYQASTIATQTIMAISQIYHSVSGVVFLSGGLSVSQSTLLLACVHDQISPDFLHTFSFGRAIQDSAFVIWSKNSNDIESVQQNLIQSLYGTSQAISTPGDQ